MYCIHAVLSYHLSPLAFLIFWLHFFLFFPLVNTHHTKDNEWWLDYSWLGVRDFWCAFRTKRKKLTVLSPPRNEKGTHSISTTSNSAFHVRQRSEGRVLRLSSGNKRCHQPCFVESDAEVWYTNETIGEVEKDVHNVESTAYWFIKLEPTPLSSLGIIHFAILQFSLLPPPPVFLFFFSFPSVSGVACTTRLLWLFFQKNNLIFEFIVNF